MNIRDRNAIIDEADWRLNSANCDHRKLVLIYSGTMTAVLAFLTVVLNLLQSSVADTGGLGGIGIRSMIQTAILALQFAGNLAIPFWSFGYVLCILGVVRGQRMKSGDLLAGFRRFGPVLRLNLYRGLRYMMIGFLSSYPVLVISQLILPADDAAATAMPAAVIGVVAAYVGCYTLLAAPVFYQLRLADYILMDEPKTGVMMAVRKSTMLMQGNRMEMFKLDLRFWWYYVIQAAATAVSYAPLCLTLLGAEVPIMADYVCCGVCLVLQFGITVLVRNRVEAVTAVAYEILNPPKPAEEE
jgi:uncharacterized membrane protein